MLMLTIVAVLEVPRLTPKVLAACRMLGTLLAYRATIAS
jgi:hypothetical protein